MSFWLSWAQQTLESPVLTTISISSKVKDRIAISQKVENLQFICRSETCIPIHPKDKREMKIIFEIVLNIVRLFGKVRPIRKVPTDTQTHVSKQTVS